MATTLDAYRSLRPDDQRSDAEILESLVTQFTNDGSIAQFPQLSQEWNQLQKQQRLDMAPGYLQEGTQAIGSGIDMMQAKLYEGTAGLVGGLTGLDGLRDWGLEGYQQNMAEAQEYQPTVAKSSDVEDLNTALRYGIGVVGQNVPQFAATAGIAAGVTGAGFLMGGPAGAAAAAPYALGGAAGFGAIQNQNYATLLEQGGESPELTAITVGAVSGFLETIVPLKVLNKFKGTPGELRPYLEEVVKTMAPSLRGNLLKAAASNSAGEGITEAAQEAISIAGELYSNRNNPNFLLDPATISERIRESAIAGSLVGGIVSPVEGVKTYMDQRSRWESLQDPVAVPELLAPEAPLVIPPTAPKASTSLESEIEKLAAKIRSGGQDFTPEEMELYQNHPGMVETLLRADAPVPKSDDLPLTVDEKQGNKTVKTPLEQYLAVNSAPGEQTWTELEPVEVGNDIVLRPKQETLALDNGVVDVEVTGPQKATGFPALKQGIVELPELESTIERFKETTTPIEVVVALKDRMLEHSTKGAPTGATKRLFAYQDSTTGEVYVAGAYLGTGNNVFLHTGLDQLPTRADIARELDVSEASVKKALAPNSKSDSAVSKRIREHVQGLTYGLRKKNMSLNELLELKSPSGQPKFKPVASVTLKSLALQNHSPWDVSTDVRLKYDSLADFESVAGAADAKAAEFVEQQKTLSTARESRSKLFMDRMAQLEDGQRVSHAVNILSSILENDALKSKSLKVTPNAEAITLGLMRLWNPNNLARELARATSAYDLLSQSTNKKTGGRKFFGFMDETEFRDFVDAANSGDMELIKATLDDVLSERGKSIRWFSMKAAAVGDARQTHFSQMREESDVDPDASIVQDPEARESETAQPDAILTEDNLQNVDETAPSKAISFVGLTDSERTTIRKALEVAAPDVYQTFRERDGNVIKPVVNWQNDPGFLAAKPMLKMAIERTLGVTRKKTVVLSDEALYGAYLNGPVTVRYSQPLQASYRTSTGTYRQLYYSSLQTLARYGVDVKVAEQDISSAVEQLKNEWGEARMYDDGRRAVVLTIQDILNPTKENYRVLLHEAAHIVLAKEPVWVQQLIHDAVNRTASIKDQVLSRTTDRRLKDGSLSGTVLAEEILSEHLSYAGIDRPTAQGLLGRIFEFIRKLMNDVSLMYYKWRGLQSGNNALKYIEARFQSYMNGQAISLVTLDSLNGSEPQTVGEQAKLFRQSGGDVEVERLNPDTGAIEPVEVLEDTTLATVFNLDTVQSEYDLAVAAKGVPAPAVYKGFQEGLPAMNGRPEMPGFELYNLTADIPGHPEGSTVSRQTLEAAGFYVPPRVSETQPSIPEGYFLSGTRNLETLLTGGRVGKIKLANDGTVGSHELKTIFSDANVVPGANKAEWDYLKEMGIEKLAEQKRVPVSDLLTFVKNVQPTLEVLPLHVAPQILGELKEKMLALQHKLETVGVYRDAMKQWWANGKIIDEKTYNSGSPLAKLIWEYEDAYQRWKDSVDGARGTDSASANYREVNPISNKDLAKKGGVDLLLRIPVREISDKQFESLNMRPEDYDSERYETKMDELSNVQGRLYQGPHYGESDTNVVVSIRGHFEEKDGKKVFSINEVQSDWAQSHSKNPRDSKFDVVAANGEMAVIANNIETLGTEKIGKLGRSQKVRSEHYIHTSLYDIIRTLSYLKPQGEVTSENIADAKRYLELEEKVNKFHRGVAGHSTLAVHQELGLKMAMQYATIHGADAIVIADAPTVMMTEMHDRVPVESKNYLTEAEAQKDADRINAALTGVEPTKDRYGMYTVPGKGAAQVDRSPKGTYYVHLHPSLVPMIPRPLREEMRFRVYSATGMEINYDQKLPSMAEKLTGMEGQPISLGEHQNGPSPALRGKKDYSGRLYDLSNFKQKLIENQGNSIFYSRYTKPVDESWKKLPHTTGQYHNKIGLNQNVPMPLTEVLTNVLKQPDLLPELRALAVALSKHWSAEETMVYMARNYEETQIGNHSTAGFVEWNKSRLVLNPYLTYAQVRATPEEVLLHEAVHAATATAIETWHAVNNHKSSLTPEERSRYRKDLSSSFKHIEDLSFILRYLQKNFPEKIYVGEGDARRPINAFRNLHEFVADLFTERSVKDFLKGITLPKSLADNKDNAFFTIIGKILQMLGIKNDSALYSTANALSRILDATNSPQAEAALKAFNEQVNEDYRLQGGGDGDPKAKFLAKPTLSEDEAKLKYQLEYRGAIINSRIALFEELFKARADALQMPISKYITDILKLNNPYEQRDTWLLYVQNRPLPVPVNENLSIFPKDAAQSITNEVMKQQVTREVYKHVELAKTKMQADQTKVANDIEQSEKKLVRAQLNATRLDEYLNNVTALKGDILRELRTAVREVTKDLGRVLEENEKLSALGNVLQQLLAKGVNEIPESHRNIFEQILSEADTSYAFTDALTAMAKLDIDWRNSDVATIREQIETHYARSRDPALKVLMGADEISRTSLAIAIYYGKFNPRTMATLALRVEKVASEKVAAIRAIQRLVEGTEPNLQEIDDLIKSGIKESGLAARVKVEFRQAQRQFGRIKRQLDAQKNRASETEAAIPKIKVRISEIQARLGIAAENFYVAQGAPVILTPDMSAMSGELKTTPLDLKAANSTKALTQIWIDNGKWLKKHEDQKDATWRAVENQRAAIEKALGDQAIRHIKDFYVGKFLFSIPQKLTTIGLPGTRRIAQRFGDFFSKRMSMEAAQARGHEIVTSWNRAVKLSGIDPENFRTLFWNPGNRYLETTAHLLGGTDQENRARVKDGLRAYYMANKQVADLFRAKPEVYDAIWSALETNYKRGSSFMAELAQRWNVLVEDDFGVQSFRIDNPRGGVSKAYRKHLAVGYATTQRSIRNLAPVVRLMEKTWAKARDKDDEGNPTANTLTIENYHQFFSQDVIRLFVLPFINDTTHQHFPGPTMPDGETRFYASGGNVREAWAGSNNDVGTFALNLYALEKNVTPQEAVTKPDFAEYQEAVLDTFVKKFFQMHALVERSSVISNQLGLDSLPHQLMDARESDNLPAEFLDYTLYTPTTVHVVANQLAAISAFGRDLGITDSHSDGNKGLMWELNAAVQELEQSVSDINSRRALLRANNPLATPKQIENALEKELGLEEYNRSKRVPEKINELKKIQDEVYLYFRRPNGDTKDISWFMEGIRTLANLMVNNFKTTAFTTMTLFDHLFGLRLNKTGLSVVKNNWSSLVKTGWTSVAEAFGMQLSRTSSHAEYLRRFKDLGILQDLGNMIDSESILADPGHKYSYLNDSKVLGYIRKGRQFYFNIGVKTKTGVKVRPLAPFSSGNTTINIASVMGSLGLYRQLLDAASNYFLLGRMQTDYENAGFVFKASDFPEVSPEAYAELRAQFEDMGTTLEIAARKVTENKLAGKLGLEQIPDDLTRNIAAQTIRNVTLQSDVVTAPPWMFTNAFGRAVSPLLTWPLARVGQILKSMGDAHGEVGLASVRSFLALMLFGLVPAGIAMTMLLDKYDEDILGKKSNLASFSAEGDVGHNMTALVERLGRAGTFGLAGDVVNGIRIYGSDGDLRGLSFDQRVLFANTLLTSMGLLSTVAHQGGDVTYATFWRPLMNTMGGSGYLQNAQILNNLTNSVTNTPIFEAEAQVTARLNAQNYLRSTGRVLGMDVKLGSGQRYLPTPVRPWITNMVLAAYSGDSVGFAEAYRKAVQAAREMGNEEPEQYVKRSYATYHPLRQVFRTPPTASDVARLYATMGTSGARDVQSAVNSFNAFGVSLGLKPFEPKESTQKSLPKPPTSVSLF